MRPLNLVFAAMTSRPMSFLFAISTTAVSMVFSGFLWYWLLIDTGQPLREATAVLLNQNGTVSNGHFRPGELFLVRRRSCVVDEGPALYTRQLIADDGSTFYLPSTLVQLSNEGCRFAYNVVPLPIYMPPGNYTYAVTVHFQNNPLTSVTQTLPTSRLVIDPL